MKKLYLFLVTMIAALTVHATDYYLIGGFNDWNDSARDAKFVAQSDGTLKYSYSGAFSGKFKIFAGSWSDASNIFGAPSNASNTTVTLGTAFTLGTGADTKDMSLSSASVDNPTFVFNPTAKTLTVTGTQGTATITYCLHGQIGDGTNWKDLALTENNGSWSYSGQVKKGQFGIKQLTNGKQSAWIAANGTSTISAPGTFSCKADGSNFTNNLAGDYTFSYNPTANTLTVTANGGEDPNPPTPPTPTTDYTGWYINVGGDFNGEGTAWFQGTAAAADGNTALGTYAIGTDIFKIKVWDATNKKDIYYSAASVTTGNNTLSVGVENDEMTIAGAAAGDNYTLNFNLATGVLTVTKVEGPVQEVTTYVFRGQITGHTNWADIEATEANGKWSFTADVVPGEFGIKKMVNDKQKAWIAAGSNANISAAGTFACAVDGANFSSTLEGNYTFSFDPTASTLTITKNGGEDPNPPTPPTPTTDYTGWYINVGGDFNGEGTAWFQGTAAAADGNTALGTYAIGTDIFKIKVWDATNEKDIYYSAASVTTGNNTLSVGTKDDEMTIAGAAAGDSYTLNFNLATGVLTVTKVEGPVQEVTTYVFHGQLANGSDWADIAATESNGKWSFTADVKPGEFGIKKMVNDKQKAWIAAGSNANISAAGTFACAVDGSNFKSTLEGNYTLTFDPEAMTLVVVKNGGEDPNPPTPPTPTEDYTGWYINVGGDFNGEGTAWFQGTAAAADGNTALGTYAIGTDIFKIKVWDATNEKDIYYSAASVTTGNNTLTVGTEDDEMTIAGAAAGDSYTLNFNLATGVLTVTKVEGPVQEVTTYVFHGQLANGSDWADIAATESNGKWSFTADVKPGEFGIKKMVNDKQKAWIAAGSNATISAAGTFACAVDGANFKNEIESNCTFTFDPEAMTLTVVDNNSGAVETIFGTNGVKVANGMINVPAGAAIFTANGTLVSRGTTSVAPGLYIVVVDGAAQKMLVK